MKKHAINHLAVSVALSLVCSGALAHSLYWTGETDNIWSKAANWYNKDTGKVAGSFPGIPNLYDHLAYFDQTLADGVSKIKQRTVVFNKAELMRGSVYIYDGTMADPIVFSASDNYGLSITNSAKRFWIGSDDGSKPGWLKMQGGSFSSNPELKINNGGWIMDGDASFSTTNNIQIGSAKNCSATAVFNSGSITQTKVGNGSYFYVGYSQGSVGTVTNAGATITIANSFRMGYAASTSAYYYQSGGSLNIDNRLVIGYASDSENSVFEIAGGTVTMAGTPIRFAYSGSLLLKGGIVSPTSIKVEDSSNDKRQLQVIEGRGERWHDRHRDIWHHNHPCVRERRGERNRRGHEVHRRRVCFHHRRNRLYRSDHGGTRNGRYDCRPGQYFRRRQGRASLFASQSQAGRQ